MQQTTTRTTTTVEYNADGEPTYMEQEDEWEREGLLDPAWEKQQKKVRGYLVLDQIIPTFKITNIVTGSKLW